MTTGTGERERVRVTTPHGFRNRPLHRNSFFPVMGVAGLLFLGTAGAARAQNGIEHQNTPSREPPVVVVPPAASAGSADNPRAPVAYAVRRTGAIVVDGRLDEADWADAPFVDELTQVIPDEGRPASQRTEFRVLYDEEAIYVSARAWDDGPITTRLGRRDMALSDSDWIGIVLDSYHDHRTGFTFDVNPGGVRRDATKSTAPGGHEQDDNSWDGVWEGAAAVDDQGWSVEYRIPFSQLRFDQSQEQVWGIQFERVIGRRKEYSVSSFTPRSERGGIAAYGHLEGLEGLEPGDRLELLPYMVARSEHVDPGLNPYRTDSEQALSGGLDLRYRISSNFTLNASINPDFGQVEVDPAVVNLGVYETFFEEKRPFFIEGSEIFNFPRGNSGAILFHSRRVGRSPHLSPGTPYADVPGETTILGAGKVSGKTPSGWSFGLLEAVTSQEEARYQAGEGAPPQTMTVEPLTNYLVARARRDWGGGQSSMGGMLTTVNRRLQDPLMEATLTSSAYAAGVDLDHEFADRVWAVRAQVSGSRVAGSTDAITAIQRFPNHYFQRPDADHLEVDPEATSLSGYAVSASLEKQAGEHWLGSLGGAITSPEYEVNDLGYGNRTDRRDLTWTLTYRDIQPGDFFRDWSLSFHGRNENNFDWERILLFNHLGFRFNHLSYWGASASVTHFAEALDDRSTRGGPMMLRPSGYNFRFGLNSDPRKSVTVNVESNIGISDYDTNEYSAGIGLGIKTSSRWNLTIGPSVYLADRSAQYVGTIPDVSNEPTYGSYYLFAPLEQTQVSLETRFNFTFRPGLTLEVYLQPLISSGNYGDAGYLTEAGEYEFAEYEGNVPDRDFNLRSLRGNAVLRWEWRQGSDIYVAWQQRRQDYENIGDFDFGRDREALWGAPPDNIFVVKVNYWFTQ
jgi:hypothetical protein